MRDWWTDQQTFQWADQLTDIPTSNLSHMRATKTWPCSAIWQTFPIESKQYKQYVDFYLDINDITADRKHGTRFNQQILRLNRPR